MARQALILYYSEYGNTARLATKIQQVTGADILRLQVPKGTFPDEMTATDDVYQKQRKQGKLPTIITELPDLSYYDTLLIGGPVWDGQISSPIMTLLKLIQHYSGNVAPFSSGWSDTGHYQADFEAHAGKLHVLSGYHVLTNGTPKYSGSALSSWLRKL